MVAAGVAGMGWSGEGLGRVALAPGREGGRGEGRVVWGGEVVLCGFVMLGAGKGDGGEG